MRHMNRESVISWRHAFQYCKLRNDPVHGSVDNSLIRPASVVLPVSMSLKIRDIRDWVWEMAESDHALTAIFADTARVPDYFRFTFVDEHLAFMFKIAWY